VLQLVEVVGFFFFFFCSFLVASSDFQVLAREERWVLVDFRWRYVPSQIFYPQLDFLQQELARCGSQPFLVGMVT
jgi:hypothetical protein